VENSSKQKQYQVFSVNNMSSPHPSAAQQDSSSRNNDQNNNNSLRPSYSTRHELMSPMAPHSDDDDDRTNSKSQYNQQRRQYTPRSNHQDESTSYNDQSNSHDQNDDDDSDDSPYDDAERAMLARRRMRNPSYMHLFEEDKNEQRPIEEHGLIGNMHTVAMISTDATMVWYCYPHFDSPSIFNRLLDAERGGCWIIRPAIETSDSMQSSPDQFVYKQLYHSETNVLISRFFSENGVAQCTDYMPIQPNIDGESK
jgi:hypothetical protein